MTMFQELECKSITPMMQQYLAIKIQHKDQLLFYRMGDFYELFFDDAITAAPIMDVTLTKRGSHDGNDIPMCGVPFHAAAIYIQKLIRKGYSIAICEQLETPQEAKKRSYKAVVKRDVIKIITPGTVLEDSLLEAKSNNYLAAITKIKDDFAIAWMELSTGDFKVISLKKESIADFLNILMPQEILIDDNIINEERAVFSTCTCFLNIRQHSLFDHQRAINRILDFFKINSLSGFAKFDPQEICAAGCLLEYVQYTQKTSLLYLKKLSRVEKNQFMFIDQNTKKHLEIMRSNSENRGDALIDVIDCTKTVIGSRLLAKLLSFPLIDSQAINRKLAAVEVFFLNQELRSKLRDLLQRFPDVERACSRIYSKRGSPKDLHSIKDGLHCANLISEFLLFNEKYLNQYLSENLTQLSMFHDLTEDLKAALSLDPPTHIKNGGCIRNGYSPQLDSLRNFEKSVNKKIESLREQYRLETGVTNLKISNNNVIGYFVEIPSSQSAKITSSDFVHRQSLGSVTRYVTNDLKELETALSSCEERSLCLEEEIFEELCSKIVEKTDGIMLTANAIAEFDVFSALGQLAKQQNYVRPYIDEGDSFVIKNGRHPVVERSMSQGQFTVNDCNLEKESNFYLITGPNMAGKSTFLRQNAIIAVMAQIGSFIPASQAHIGVIDKIFSRIGAGDHISSGQSTFMVEMLETAYILNNATEKSLLILDEIGRGTSTYDGLAIAWSVVEYLHNFNKGKVLFATHYHELGSLEGELKRLKCYQMLVQEWDKKIIFLHKVSLGKADKSYGIHVAQLSGMPVEVINRAYEILAILEQK